MILLFQFTLLLSTSLAAKTLVVTPARAEQSSDYYSDKNFASWAIDGDLSTGSSTANGADNWLRVYFSTDLEVGKVVLERGWQPGATCTYQLFIYQGDTKYPCGDKVTFPYGRYYTGYDNTTMDCGGKRGGSVVLQQSVCGQYIGVQEIKVYLPESGPYPGNEGSGWDN